MKLYRFKKNAPHVVKHLHKHRLKYLGSVFAGFTVVKAVVLFVGFFGLIHLGNIFAAEVELNSTNITQAPYNCSIDDSNCDLSDKGITSIAPDTFSNHHNLLFLNLGNNQLTSLPENLFQGDIPLVSIVLSSNQLATLPENIFHGLDNLQYLFLTNNQFVSLPSGIFNGLTQLNVLYLSENDLNQLDTNVFESLISLGELHLENNNLATISDDVFSGLSDLGYLFLNDNKLVSLGNINILSSLATGGLNIDNNRIDYNLMQQSVVDFLDEKATNGWKDTQTFGTVLNSGNIDIICPTTATICDLSGRNIYAIAADTFINHHNLQTLNLSRNRLTELPVGLFDPLTGLVVLDLSENQISSLGNIDVLDSLINGSEIDYSLHSNSGLNIKWNYINPALLSPKVFSFLSLKSVPMKDSMRTSTQTYTPIMFTGGEVNSGNIGLFWHDCSPWNTIRCVLTGDSITSIASDTFNEYDFQDLIISGTSLHTLPEGLFTSMTGISTLNLGYNQLTGLTDDQFAGLDNLQYLYLNNNEFSTIKDNQFDGLINLQYLYLNNNQIDFLPQGLFNQTTSITTLNLGYNQLTGLTDDQFAGLDNLQNLYLNNNKLSILGNIGTLTGLRENGGINVHYNYIDYRLLDQDMLDFIDSRHDQNNGNWRYTQTIATEKPLANNVEVLGNTGVGGLLYGYYDYSHILLGRSSILTLPEDLQLTTINFDQITHQLYGISSDEIIYGYTGGEWTTLATVTGDIASLVMNNGVLYTIGTTSILKYVDGERIDISGPLPDETPWIVKFVIDSGNNLHVLAAQQNENCGNAASFFLYAVHDQQRTLEKSVAMQDCPDGYNVFMDSARNIYIMEILSSKITFLSMTRDGVKLFDSETEVRGDSEMYIKFNKDNVPYFPYYPYGENTVSLFTYDNDTAQEILDMGNVGYTNQWSDYSSFSLDNNDQIYLTRVVTTDDGDIPYISIYSGEEVIDLPALPAVTIQKFIISPDNNLPYLLWYDEGNIGHISTYAIPGLPEGNSKYQWYRNGSAISGANSTGYIITSDDLGTSLTFGVTPYNIFNQSGQNTISSPLTLDPQSSTPNINPNSQGGNSGTPLLTKDICEQDRDCSSSYYDKLCGPCPAEATGHFVAPLSGDITNSPYSAEITNAYQWAYSIGITTQDNITDANINGNIARAHLAKMVSEYAIKIQKRKPDTSMSCTFQDIGSQSNEMKFYIKLACQLGLMGLKSDGTPDNVFVPKGSASRAEFATILSRMLYGNTYNIKKGETVKWYSKHVQALYNKGIITKINDLFSPEKRGWVFIMLQRTVQ